MKRLLHIAIITLVAALVACSDDSCPDNGSSLPLAACFVNGSQQTVTGLTVMGIGVPGDSLLADGEALKEIYLPLRAGATTTSYMVARRLNDSTLVSDTVTFDYQPIEFFHSIECGAMYNFDIKGVRHTGHGIDSVVVLTPLVTNARIPVMRIYFSSLNS